MCALVDEFSGSVRLARHGGSWGLVVTVQGPTGAEAPRAAGYTFAEIDELPLYARLVSEWLATTTADHPTKENNELL